MADETPTQAAAAAEMRRRWLRWLTLGEILGVAALVISGLTFWNSYEERRHGEAEKVAESKQATVKARTLVLRAVAEKDGDRLTISAVGDQSIQGQTIAFPSALGVDPVDSTNQRIEQGWFASGLKKARRAVGDDDRTRGDARLPVAITTRFFTDGTLTEDVALYDVGYVTDSSFLGGTSIKLRGLSLIGHSKAKAVPARLDALWAARHPNKVKS